MPTDIYVDGDFQTAFDARGDLTAVTGDDYLVQRTVIRIISVSVQWKGEPITPQRAEEYRSNVAATLADDDEINVPTTVSIQRVGDTSLTLAVDLGEQQLLLTGP